MVRRRLGIGIWVQASLFFVASCMASLVAASPVVVTFVAARPVAMFFRLMV